MIRHISARYGHRGAWLIILGTTWCLFGVGVLLDPPDPRPWVLYELTPAWMQAAGWWITGTLAIWQGLRGPACPERPDTLGHVALYLMPAIRLVSFALSSLLWFATSAAAGLDVMDEPVGFQAGWYAAAVWAIVSAMLHHAASWPEPNRPIPRPPANATGGDHE